MIEWMSSFFFLNKNPISWPTRRPAVKHLSLKPDKSSSALTPDVEPRNPIPKSCSPIPRMCHPHIIPLYSVPPTIIKNNKVLRKKELDFFQK